MTSGQPGRRAGPDSVASVQAGERPVAVASNGDQSESPEAARTPRVLRICANLVGAGGAVLFARAGLQHYLRTHSLVGGLFLAEQVWIVVAYLVRRPALRVSQRTSDWLLAFGGTFGGVMFRPDGAHLPWGLVVGLGLQLVGIGLCITSFFALGRSFGFAPADRGLRHRGPYSVVRHPIYASYLLLQLGYVLQSLSVRNALVMIFVCSCNVGRALAEERFLMTGAGYSGYRATVCWRLVPGVW